MLIRVFTILDIIASGEHTMLDWSENLSEFIEECEVEAS